MCSAKLDADPTDAVRLTVRPLKKDDTSPRLSVRVLKSVLWPTMLVAEPTDAVKATVRPLKNDEANPRASEKARNKET